MLSSGFSRPLPLKRKPSRLFAVFLLVMHGLALAALLLPLALTDVVHTALFVGLMASAFFHLAYYQRQQDNEAYWVWDANGSWRYGDNHQAFQVVLTKTVQTPWFVTIALRNAERQQQLLLILGDQLDADSFRRLRVRLKLHQEEAATSSGEAV
jgi:hypothetical protein